MVSLSQSLALRSLVRLRSTNGLLGKPVGWQVEAREVPTTVIPIRSWHESDTALRKPPYVQIVRKPDGRTYCYFRRRGRPRVDLPEPSDSAFEQAYAQALVAEAPPVGSSLRPAAAGTFDALAICGFRRKSATDSDLKSATDSDAKPATRSGAIRPPIPI